MKHNTAASGQADSDMEALARQVAYIMGDSCAAAQALRKVDACRAKGGQADIMLVGNTWVVGTTPSSSPAESLGDQPDMT